MSRGSLPFAGAAAAALSICALVACGKKGPPLAPIRPVPGPVVDLAARRAGNEVRFTFKVPAQNLDATKPVSLDRLEVYAVTVAPYAPVPPNRDLLAPKYLVATIPVRPVEEEAADGQASAAPGQLAPATVPEKKEDSRPAPGDSATFVEELNEARLEPQEVTTQATPGTAPRTTTEVAAAWAASIAQLTEAPVTSRIYVIRGVSLQGRPGQPSVRVTVPVMEVLPPPTDLTASVTESNVTLSWSAPAPTDPLSALGAAPAFNVYTGSSTSPLNPAPLSVTNFARAGLAFGKEECFVTRTAVTRGNLTVESAASAPACVTAADTFPPAAPKGLSVVATTGSISLIWEANTESDIGGYLVLRGEVPGDKLQAITATPIRDTTFRDATAVPGTRYVYAIVAVDRATPANTSPQSARVEETAR